MEYGENLEWQPVEPKPNGPFYRMKLHPISNTTYTNPLDPDLYLNPHETVLTRVHYTQTKCRYTMMKIQSSLTPKIKLHICCFQLLKLPCRILYLTGLPGSDASRSQSLLTVAVKCMDVWRQARMWAHCARAHCLSTLVTVKKTKGKKCDDSWRWGPDPDLSRDTVSRGKSQKRSKPQ